MWGEDEFFPCAFFYHVTYKEYIHVFLMFKKRKEENKKEMKDASDVNAEAV